MDQHPTVIITYNKFLLLRH